MSVSAAVKYQAQAANANRLVGKDAGIITTRDGFLPFQVRTFEVDQIGVVDLIKSSTDVAVWFVPTLFGSRAFVGIRWTKDGKAHLITGRFSSYQ
jgi:hypothetical protein